MQLNEQMQQKVEKLQILLKNKDEENKLFIGDNIDILQELYDKNGEFVDMIFADPPYFLSNDGFTCQNGKMVKVNKGDWDKSKGAEENHKYNLAWLSVCQKVLKRDGTIWISGTQHVIFDIGFALQQLGFKILNMITWEKPNPAPNLSCRYFTHSTELLIWASKSEKSKHTFNYDAMRKENRGKQMKSVWTFTTPKNSEKTFGKHPTQKPVDLLNRIIKASTNEGDIVLDPFLGSGTTAVSCILNNRKYIGIEKEKEYFELAKKRVDDAEIKVKNGLWKVKLRRKVRSVC
ncbi:MAG: site-specific DNA-methyltransferase [Rickettsiales bacterium]|nr:site-specific DNA-methyltransferase [Rickettsiales bacterium]